MLLSQICDSNSSSVKRPLTRYRAALATKAGYCCSAIAALGGVLPLIANQTSNGNHVSHLEASTDEHELIPLAVSSSSSINTSANGSELTGNRLTASSMHSSHVGKPGPPVHRDWSNKCRNTRIVSISQTAILHSGFRQQRDPAFILSYGMPHTQQFRR